MSLHFAVFYGSVRSERQGIEYARFLNAQLAARGHHVSFVDPLEYRLPLLDKMQPRMGADHVRSDRRHRPASSSTSKPSACSCIALSPSGSGTFIAKRS